MSSTKVFRFKFSQEILEEMQKFARIHKFDERNDFKDAWKIWTDNNHDIILAENNRLSEIGFKGDIIEKMYKSVRYYYIKKSNAKQEPKKRRKYITIDKDILDTIDRHITNCMDNCDIFKPSNGFTEFIEANGESVISSLDKTGLSESDINNKLKKTYKNRYFLIKNKTNQEI